MTLNTTTKTVRIYIDEQEYELPAGTNLVDAAKWIGNDIPVFCYHPKMAPVGMCRMCLVETGNIMTDRATGEVQRDESGNAQIRWMPKLQTACTMTVSDGLVIRTNTDQVTSARKNVIEFLLTSHPLDCPICDKGGECPLQNLTMEHGPGTSRMIFEDKLRLEKHVPLGDLIYLDQERCIQCARCIRFQDEVAGDPVIGFHERGRYLRIVTLGDQGFDSYFSGNTTDICPVGALTTEDFRFGARPWELTNVPSICQHCPGGCNTSLSTRLDRDFGGRAVIKRVMPRQNESVNEIWICDKGRFGHHYTRSDQRLTEPMVKGHTTSWIEAIRQVADVLKAANGDVAAIAGSSMSNEDLWTLKQLVSGLGGTRLGAWRPTHAGAEQVAQVGVGKGTNLSNLTKGDAVLIIATDLEEEAPMWRLRLKQANDRGAYVVVANARPTDMDKFVSETVIYPTGAAASFMANLTTQYTDLAQKLSGAENLIIVAGAEGLTLEGSKALAQSAANFLIETNHVGKPQNGLMVVLPGSNGMGQHYLGFTPDHTVDIINNPPRVLVVAQADVLSDDPSASTWLNKVETVIAFSLFPDALTQKAAFALPIQSYAERDGTVTNGERRVQRYYTAQGPMGEALPAWQAFSRIGEKLGQGMAKVSAAAVMLEITQNVPAFAGMRYSELAKVERQFPEVGGNDLYYGGTSYKNLGGLGIQIPSAADGDEAVKAVATQTPEVPKVNSGEFVVVPTTRLYNRERTFRPSIERMMSGWVEPAYVEINSVDAGKLRIQNGDLVQVTVAGESIRVTAHVNGAAPEGTVLLPRHLSETATPLSITVGAVSKVEG